MSRQTVPPTLRVKPTSQEKLSEVNDWMRGYDASFIELLLQSDVKATLLYGRWYDGWVESSCYQITQGHWPCCLDMFRNSRDVVWRMAAVPRTTQSIEEAHQSSRKWMFVRPDYVSQARGLGDLGFAREFVCDRVS
jgi:hypothetical protein